METSSIPHLKKQSMLYFQDIHHTAHVRDLSHEHVMTQAVADLQDQGAADRHLQATDPHLANKPHLNILMMMMMNRTLSIQDKQTSHN